ncbi:DUF1109 domain-containing protein (plasmid) [Sphingomonas paeninsulae]|uniref:DUF1109 domain-containing protein n=1 Tax=Sphingomonas paeninsulae TaxID=2319844 RepID=A0A494THQ6_SPHPE|nr:DUF1109 domain-containing protein [Sphingomonas paeninsulae]AYJ85341.1 DUF1109 domain-containing protein [Sphingomonas paeninsulae]
MRTEDLILSLADNIRPVTRGSVPRRITIGLMGGGVVTMTLIVALLGLRPNLDHIMHGFPFWMKWGYTISIFAVAIRATIHLARPDADRPRWLWWLAVPALILASLAAGEMTNAPPGGWTGLWMGQSWRVCSLLVFGFSLPIFAGLMIAFRSFAPTRLRLTGAVAGLAAGGFASTLYGLHCPEASALFVFLWYSLGISMAAGLGALVGPKFLRW